MLSPTSTPSSPTAQQSMALSTNASSNTNAIVPQSPTGSTSPHALVDSSSMSITSTGVMQSDEYWRSRYINYKLFFFFSFPYFQDINAIS